MSSRQHPGTYQLREQDCVVGMQSMPAQSVDVIVTSPPYNLGVNYGKYKDRLPVAAYLEWTASWLSAAKRVLKENGSLFLNLGAIPSSPSLPFQVLLKAEELFVLQNTFHWIKSISVETREGELVTAGHFKPINSHRYVTDCHEFVFHLTKTGDVPVNRLKIGVPYKDKSNIKRWKHTRGSDVRCRGNTWFIPYETIRRRVEERPHPATFPVQLAKNCILLHGAGKDSKVVDPFVGLGSSAVAAFECGVGLFEGFDIEKAFLDRAVVRLQEHATQPLALNLEYYESNAANVRRAPEVRQESQVGLAL